MKIRLPRPAMAGLAMTMINMKLDVFDLTGTKVEQITLSKEVFEAKINDQLMAQAVRAYQGNQRMAGAKAKSRGEINRTTKKVYRQKGTGQARHGSRRAPIYVGGGAAHGPTGEQNYSLDLPKKMRVAALRSALSLLAKEKKILLINGFADLKEPKTKDMAGLLDRLITIAQQRNIGLVLDNKMEVAVKSFRNIAKVNVFNAQDLTTFEVVKSHWLVMAVESLKTLESRLIKKQ